MKENAKLRYELEVSGTSVLFKILWMDERFRSDGDKIKKHLAKNSMVVKSDNSIGLIPSGIYLRGSSKTYDKNYFLTAFDSYKEAQEYVTNVHIALKDWAENWEGWEEKSQPEVEEKSIRTIYEV